jgi:hypothetical protein
MAVFAVHLFDEDAGPVILRVIPDAASKDLLLFKLAPRLSSGRPSDPALFGLSKAIWKRERHRKAMKTEAEKVFTVLLAFYSATILPMIRWTFERALVLRQSDQILGPMNINSRKLLERLEVPQITVADSFYAHSILNHGARKQRIPKVKNHA